MDYGELIKMDVCERITVSLLKRLNKYYNMDEYDKEYIFLGSYIITELVTKSCLLLTTSMIFGLTKEVFIMTIMFLLIRFFSSGIHMKSSLSCTIISLIFYLGGSFIAERLLLSNNICLIILVILGSIIVKYSPADTEKRPILGAEKRKALQLRSGIVTALIIIFNILLGSNIVFKLTTVVLLFQMISVIPITYKVMKENYNNYLNYE